MNLLGGRGDGVHLDPLPFGIVPGIVPHLFAGEIAARDAVDVAEDIENEIGGHALSVIVGLFQNISFFDAVDSQEKKVVGSHGCGQVLKESDEFDGGEVAHRAAEKDKERGQALFDAGESFLVPGEEPVKPQLWESFGDRIAGQREASQAYVDRSEGSAAPLAHVLLEQVEGFFRGPGAEFHDAFDRGRCDHALGLAGQDGVFGPSQIIFRQLADPLEEPGASLVVKMVGLQPGRLVQEGPEDRQRRIVLHVILFECPDGWFRQAP